MGVQYPRIPIYENPRIYIYIYPFYSYCGWLWLVQSHVSHAVNTSMLYPHGETSTAFCRRLDLKASSKLRATSEKTSASGKKNVLRCQGTQY